ncbi:MAG: 3-hydroxyacyl-ACP dehydratase [Flavobacteriales bacterium]|nr:3-hydroxyacyl-ACP dehydratase [Flavobacteriales bacterium]
MSDNIYQITEFSFSEGVIKAHVLLNENHPIFGGHFPGQPVLPGVCQLRMVKELTEKALNTRLNMQQSDQIKFLSMIDPRKTPSLDVTITLQITEEKTTAQSMITMGEYTFLKSKAIYQNA